jgi:hypothetical protein
MPANNIAKWDGTVWSTLGSGVGGVYQNAGDYVQALTVQGSDLYAAGGLATAGGLPANLVARWDGNAWSALGSGIDGFVVQALAITGDQLYVGGIFTDAGGKVSGNLARGFLEGVPPIEINGHRATSFFRNLPAGPYLVDRSSDLKTWETLATRYAGETGGLDFTDEATPQSAAFYRAVPVPREEH